MVDMQGLLLLMHSWGMDVPGTREVVPELLPELTAVTWSSSYTKDVTFATAKDPRSPTGWVYPQKVTSTLFTWQPTPNIRPAEPLCAQTKAPNHSVACGI